MRQVCGLDVHKDTIFACIMDNSGVIFQEKFGTLTSELSNEIVTKMNRLDAALQRWNWYSYAQLDTHSHAQTL